MHYWAEKGADKRKLIMGMPMYGQTFTLNSPTPNGLKAPAGKGIAGEFTKQEGFNAYYEVNFNCNMLSGTKPIISQILNNHFVLGMRQNFVNDKVGPKCCCHL